MSEAIETTPFTISILSRLCRAQYTISIGAGFCDGFRLRAWRFSFL